MLKKPELIENAGNYGRQTIYEYENLIDGLEMMKREDLKALLQCVYKDGVKDGITFCMKLETE